MIRSSVAGRVAVAVALAACTRAEPSDAAPGNAGPPPAVARRPGLRLAVRAAPLVVGPGDTVRFTAVARNATRDTLQVGRDCGPTMDVAVTGPSGARASVLGEMVRRPRGMFVCVLTPAHSAPPRDSVVERLHWRAPARRGEYVAVAGARAGARLTDLSAPVRIRVR